MHSLRSLGLLASLMLAAGLGSAQQEVDAGAAERQQQIDARAEQTLQELFAVKPSARDLYEQAAGYAAFTATKAGFFVTGGGGTGVAVDKNGGQRTYMRMGTGGLGLGIGAQRYDLVILFEQNAQLDRFIEGGWDASATALAAAGTDGIALNSSFIEGVAVYQLTKRGLMAQADVSGTRFWPIDALNH